MENIPIDLNVREDKPAFNIDRLLSIHQSYSLEGIKRLNVEMLKAQYAQCEQLTQLQKQIDQGNKISMQILRNQIREIENRERQKFYKAMVFNLAMFCDHIGKIEPITLRAFILPMYATYIEGAAKDAMEHLEEIPDKTHCQSIIDHLQKITAEVETCLPEYQQSGFAQLVPLKAQLEQDREVLEQEFEEEKKQIEAPLIKVVQRADTPSKHRTSVWIWGLLTILFLIVFFPVGVIFGCLFFRELNKSNRGKERVTAVKPQYENLEKVRAAKTECMNTYLAKVQKLEQEHPYTHTLAQLSAQYPRWQQELETVYELFLKFTKGITDSNSSPKQHNSLFAAVARTAVEQGTISVASILQMFEVSPNRAKRIIEQLENSGIIGPQIGTAPREIMYSSIPLLESKLAKLGFAQYDSLFVEVARTAVAQGTISVASILRTFEIGVNRAERIMEQLEKSGIIGRQIGTTPREIMYSSIPSLELKLKKLGVIE